MDFTLNIPANASSGPEWDVKEEKCLVEFFHRELWGKEKVTMKEVKALVDWVHGNLRSITPAGRRRTKWQIVMKLRELNITYWSYRWFSARQLERIEEAMTNVYDGKGFDLTVNPKESMEHRNFRLHGLRNYGLLHTLFDEKSCFYGMDSIVNDLWLLAAVKKEDRRWIGLPMV